MPEVPGELSPDHFDALREAHGDHTANVYASLALVDQQLESGTPFEDILTTAEIAEDDYTIRAAHTLRVVDELSSRLLEGPPQGKIRSILSQDKSRKIDPFASELADDIVARLGFQPDILTLDTLVQPMINAVIRTNAGLVNPGKPDTESALINKLTAQLAARSDTSRYSDTVAMGHPRNGPIIRNIIRQTATQLTQIYSSELGRAFNPDFFEQKLMLINITQYHAALADRAKGAMTESITDQAGEHVVKDANTKLAAAINKLRAYGLKPMAFPADDYLPGHSIVLHEFDELGIKMQDHEQPLATVRLARNNNPQLEISHRETSAISDSTNIQLGDTASLVLVDRNGELWVGSSIDMNALPLRVIFEKSDETGKYELLRAKVLKAIFDATVPVMVARQLETEDKIGSSVPSTTSIGVKPVSSAALINQVLLPRTQYLTARKPRQIREAFEEAKAEEAREEAGQAAQTADRKEQRWHEVVAHTPLLPPGARPTARAIELSKKEWGEHYELPPGRTFRKKHERGTLDAGLVAGYIAVAGTVERDS